MKISWFKEFSEGDYINDCGRVISLTRLIKSTKGSRRIPIIERKLHVSNSGYLFVSVKGPAGSTKSLYIHRLVAQHFIPNPLNLAEVNHLDGDKLNNHISNLEWCSREDNVRHSRYKLGFDNSGVYNGGVKLTAADVESIWALREQGYTQKDISELFPISKGQVGKILRGEKWRKLSQKLGYLT